jgi:hypothetical protein
LKLQKMESSWPKNYDWSTVCKSLTSPFLFIKKWLFYHQRGFSNLEKNTLICYQRAMLPFESGVTALCS